MAGIGIGIGIGVGMTRGGGVSGIPFLLTSTGDGSGVSTIKLTVSEDTILTLDGTARFYSDAGGTLDESTTWTVTTGAARTRYIKCPSGTANFYIEKNKITSWGALWNNGWNSGANAASLSGDISRLTALTFIYIEGNNTLSGDAALLILLAYLYFGGSNTLSGSVAALTLLTYLLNLSASNTLSGSVAALTLLTRLYVLGNNTLLGDLSVISSGLVNCVLIPCNIINYTAGGDWSTIEAAGHINIQPGVGYGLSSAEVDLFIIEVEDTRVADREIHITLTGSNAARTAASDAAVAALIADGGTVTTNP